MSDSQNNSEIVIGIDLGTTYSCIGIWKENEVEIIPNKMGNHTTPAYVAFSEDGQRIIGESAKDQKIRRISNTIFDIKRLIGRNWNDKIVQEEIKYFPFKVIEKNSRPYVQIETRKGSRFFTPEEISAMLLKYLVGTAEDYLNEKITNVIITVPAYFNDAQRQATKNAGLIAGLNVLRIINEPTAAAIAYSLNTNHENRNIMVFDLGGGTLDVTVLEIQGKTFTVKATRGNTHLGGEDFDRNVLDHFVKIYKMKKQIDISENKRAVQRLLREIEKAKKILTFANSTMIEIDRFWEDEDFYEPLSKNKFEEVNKDMFNSILEPVKKALEDANLQKEDINEIVMVGGSSRIPKIRQLVQSFFNEKEPFQKINPDEAVAIGAAIQGAILLNKEDSLYLLDVNPLSIGVEDVNGKLDILIERNSTLPTRNTDMSTTVVDYQEEIRFAVYEGDLPVAKDNLFLGDFVLTNIEPALKGIPRIETVCEIDENGILHVSAVDTITNEKKDMYIDYSKNRPSSEEIEKMIQLFGEYDKLDKKFDESVNARIEFTEAVYSFKENLADSKNDAVEKIVEENLQWLKDNKICDVEEYNERRKIFEETVKSIE